MARQPVLTQLVGKNFGGLATFYANFILTTLRRRNLDKMGAHASPRGSIAV